MVKRKENFPTPFQKKKKKKDLIRFFSFHVHTHTNKIGKHTSWYCLCFSCQFGCSQCCDWFYKM